MSTETEITYLGKIGITIKNEYDDTMKYKSLEIVTKGGNSYVCIKDCVGVDVENTEYWQMIAQKGDKALVNGHNLLLINAGENIVIQQEDGTLTISAVMPTKLSELENDGNYAQTNKNNNFSTAQTFNGDVTVNGNITQNGKEYISHAEHIKTKNDFMTLREGATGGLADGELTGFEAKKYDGTNNGILAFGSDGVARVGDKGNEQALATRKEEADMQNGEVVIWNADTLQMETGNKDDIVRSVLPLTSGILSEAIDGVTTLVAGTRYNLGETTELSIAFPTEAKAEQECFIRFVSGETATVLTLNGDNIVGDTDIVPVASKTYEIFATYNGAKWVVQYLAY